MGSRLKFAADTVVEEVVGEAAVAVVSVGPPFAAARSVPDLLHLRSSQEVRDLPGTALATGTASAGCSWVASITTTTPTITIILPSIPLPPLSLEAAAAGC
jgi:hypothetical protein